MGKKERTWDKTRIRIYAITAFLAIAMMALGNIFWKVYGYHILGVWIAYVGFLLILGLVILLIFIDAWARGEE